VMLMMTNTTTCRVPNFAVWEDVVNAHQSINQPEERGSRRPVPECSEQWVYLLAYRCSMILRMPPSSLPVASPEVRCKRLGKVPCNTLILHLRPLYHVRSLQQAG
jgi:hypothetical protein